MTKKRLIIILATVTMLVLVACGAESEPSTDTTNTNESAQPESQVVEQVETSSTDEARLTDDYADALTIEGQLALGTLELEDTNQAVSEEQAAEMLILWQAYQSLSNSDITAAAEVEAVLNQIQDTMTADQVAAISEMKLIADSLTALIEEGGLAFGRGGLGNRGSDDGESSGFPAGAFRGGIPGQGPGGGGFPAGGPGGGGFRDLSEDDIATRQAQFEDGDFGGFGERMLTGAVIGLLQNKTGEIPEPEGIFATIYTIISEEIGLSVDDLQSQVADGHTIAQIIENNGGDIDVIQSKVNDELSSSERFQGRDVDAFVINLLGLDS